MHASAALAALVGLATASSVNGAGIVDNLGLFTKLTSLAATHYSGEYKVQNVATGEYLHFSRPDDTTNLVASYDDSQTVTLGHDSAYGQSGKNWDTWSGTYIRGLEKCMSAQWDDQLGVDHAAVSYACKVGGSSDGSDSLEVAKQFWKLVPCGSDGSDDNDDDSSAVQFNAASSSGSAKAANAKFVQASSSDDDSSASSTSSASASTQSVDPKDRSTWVCRHEGKWLARHYRYVTEAGHIECKDELEAYRASQQSRRMARRSRLAHAAALKKRASSSTYCIIAVDHLTDMTTRALTPDHIATFGGYSSLKLAEWDENDSSQHWRITSA